MSLLLWLIIKQEESDFRDKMSINVDYLHLKQHCGLNDLDMRMEAEPEAFLNLLGLAASEVGYTSNNIFQLTQHVRPSLREMERF